MRIVVIGSLAESLIGFRGPMLSEMVKAGHEVIACASGEDKGVAQQLLRMGVAYRSVKIWRTGLNPLKDLYSLWSLKRFLGQVKADVVLGYTIKPVTYGSLSARLAGVPRCYSMITGQGNVFCGTTLRHRISRPIARLLYRLALSHNEAVFFQNPDDLSLFARLGLIKGAGQGVLINGSGVDLDYYAEAPLPTGPVSFLLLARLLKEKGLTEFVEAAKVLKRRYPATVFRLFGPYDSNPSGIRERTVRGWVEAGLIEYGGEVQDVRPVIAAASVYVLPSYYGEGTPRSVLEAMAMGRPVVTTNAPGCRETVVEGENGFLVPAKDVPALVGALERFVKEPELIPRMGRRGREIAVEKYDVRKVNAVILRTMGLALSPEGAA